MKNKFFIFNIVNFLTIALFGTLSAQTTVTLYPDLDATILSSSPNNNYSDNTHSNGKSIRANASTGRGGTAVYYRSLISFDVSSVPCNATITDAKLILYGIGHDPLSGNNSVYFQRAYNFTESTVTWNSQPSVTTTGQISLSSTTSSTQIDTLNLTSYLGEIHSGLSPRNSLLMRLQNEQYYNDRYYASSDHDSVNLRPKLIIIYTLGGVNGGVDKFVCVGDSTQLIASGAETYSWSPTAGLSNPNISNPKASPSSTTSYLVTASDLNFCQTVDTVLVTVFPFPVVNAGSDQSMCAGSNVQLAATGATTYSWTPTTGLSNPNISNPVASPTSTTNYIVTGITNGCQKIDTVVVIVLSLPNVDGGRDRAICEGDSVLLEASGATTYLWSPTTGLSNPNISNPIASPTSTTTYIVTGITNGCQRNDTVHVTVIPLPTTNAGSDQSMCAGSNVQLAATGATTYSWAPTTGLSNPNISNPVASPTSTTNYIVTGITNGCQKIDTVVVTVLPSPNLNAGSDQSICLGDSVQLNATGSNTYSWSPTTGLSNSNISNPVASPTSTTNYIVTGTTNGCQKVDTVVVTVLSLPTVYAGPDQSICPGDSVQLNATGATTYDWSPNAGLSNPKISNPIANPKSTTTYTVIGFDENGCQGIDSVVVSVINISVFNVEVSPDVIICPGDTTQLSVGLLNEHHALKFDGNDDYIQILDGYTQTLKNTNEYTVSFWIGVDAFGLSPAALFDADSTTISGGFSFGINSSSELYWSVGGLTRTYSLSVPLQDSAWHLISIVKEGVGDFGKLYIDTIIQTNFTGALGNMPNENSDIYFARDRSGNYFKGYLDDIRIYNSVLDSSQINKIAFSDTLKTAGLIAYWDLNEGSDTVIFNKVSAVNGTLNNGTFWVSNEDVDLPVEDIFYDNINFYWTPALGLNTTIGNIVHASPYQTTTYTVTGVMGNGCELNSGLVTVTVNTNPLTPGSIGNNQTICYFSKADTLISLTSPTEGTGEYYYHWENSRDNQNWYPIAGAFSSSYFPGILDSSKYFRRVVYSPGCGFLPTSPVLITVYDKLAPGTIGYNQTICYNSIPDSIISLVLPSGGFGPYTYEWQYSDSGIVWTDIPGTNSSSYLPSAITVKTYYRRKVFNSCDTVFGAYVIINTATQLTSGTIISDDSEVCYNSAAGALISNPVASGGPSFYTYQWESSLDNINWSIISGATADIYYPGSLTIPTYFRRQVESGNCPIETSNQVYIIITHPGIIGSNQIICNDSTPSILSDISPASGTGPFNYQWQYSTDSLVWTDLQGANSVNYTPSNLTETTNYRRNVSSPACNNVAANVIQITVAPKVTLLPYNSINVTDSSFELFGGYPIGGTYSGTSVINNIFYTNEAGTGTHSVTYTVEMNGCSASVIQDIVVISQPFYEYTAEPTTGISFNNYGIYVNIFSDSSLASPFDTTTLNIVGHLLNERAAENRSFDNNKNGIFMNLGLIKLTKDWRNNAGDLFIPIVGKTELYGNNQKIGGTSVTQFNNLTLSGTGIKSMYIDVDVNKELNLQHLEMATRSYTLFIKNNSNGSILRTSGFVSSDFFEGKLSRAINNTQPYLFPVGSSLQNARYRPVVVAHSTSNPLIFSVRMINNSPDLPLNPADSNSTHPILVKYQDVHTINDKFYYWLNNTIPSETSDIGFYYFQNNDDQFQSIAHWSETPVQSVIFNSPVVPYWKSTNDYLGNHAFIFPLEQNRYNSLIAANAYPNMDFVAIKAWNDYAHPIFTLNKAGFVINTGAGYGNQDGTNSNVTGPCPTSAPCNDETPLNTSGNADGSGGGVVTGLPLAGTYCQVYLDDIDNTRVRICWEVNSYGAISNVHVVDSDSLLDLNYPLSPELFSIVNGTTILFNNAPQSTEINCDSPILIKFNNGVSDPILLNTSIGDKVVVSGVVNDLNLELEIFSQDNTSIVHLSGNAVLNPLGVWDGKISEVPSPGVYKIQLTHGVVGGAKIFKGQFIVQ
ncbi:MAG: LamG domain-containing protein [Bacteroidetes bacterium]|nr:LamG domain-containing protein [Bacteroidota bacterium]HET6243901.1 DNRLRE domain-containing protein [Bacteroidia bacterium]